VIGDVQLVVLGAGGLGCPALLGLRMAGAKRIVVVDHDTVESSNLHRQVLYDQGDVGASKAEVAAARMRAVGIDATAQVRKLVPEDLDGLVESLEPDAIVLECTDVPALKFACNDATVRHGRRAVIGAAIGVRGHVIAIAPGSACYRCVFEAPPPAALVPTCADAGVLGTAVGVTGFVVAQLACALADGHADDIVGRLYELALGSGIIRTLAGRARPQCPCTTRLAVPRAAT
jgi:molybdopterin/thiamine biosynthesis adenylyltransferase